MGNRIKSRHYYSFSVSRLVPDTLIKASTTKLSHRSSLKARYATFNIEQLKITLSGVKAESPGIAAPEIKSSQVKYQVELMSVKRSVILYRCSC